MAARPSKNRASTGAGSRPASPGHTRPRDSLDTFPNPSPERDYQIRMEIAEFTCLCPLTGQPDFAHFTIDVVPHRKCVELKSLKLYMWSYRERGGFHEAVTNQVLDEIVAVLGPRFARVTARWYVRGGIVTSIVAEHRKRGWKPALRVELALSGPDGELNDPHSGVRP
jgi:7-cyano-7-deazaguanine reductase